MAQSLTLLTSFHTPPSGGAFVDSPASDPILILLRIGRLVCSRNLILRKQVRRSVAASQARVVARLRFPSCVVENVELFPDVFVWGISELLKVPVQVNSIWGVALRTMERGEVQPGGGPITGALEGEGHVGSRDVIG